MKYYALFIHDLATLRVLTIVYARGHWQLFADQWLASGDCDFSEFLVASNTAKEFCKLINRTDRYRAKLYKVAAVWTPPTAICASFGRN